MPSSTIISPDMCADWVLVDGACYAYSMVTVPLYDTLGADAVQYICSHAELAAVAVSAPLLGTLLPCLGDVPTVKLVVRFTDGTACMYGRCCVCYVRPGGLWRSCKGSNWHQKYISCCS
jgi:hypothetical protein